MDNIITLADVQRTVDVWIKDVGKGYFTELTNMAVLTEETGELARVMARRFGDQVAKPGELLDNERLADEMADILWVLTALANQTGVNLTDAFLRNLEKKNKRDSLRFNERNQKGI